MLSLLSAQITRSRAPAQRLRAGEKGCGQSGSLIAFGEKKSAAATSKRTFGVHPLPAFARWPEVAGGEALAGLLCPGNAGPPPLPDLAALARGRRHRAHRQRWRHLRAEPARPTPVLTEPGPPDSKPPSPGGTAAPCGFRFPLP